jgi:hypothetical protein
MSFHSWNCHYDCGTSLRNCDSSQHYEHWSHTADSSLYFLSALSRSQFSTTCFASLEYTSTFLQPRNPAAYHKLLFYLPCVFREILHAIQQELFLITNPVMTTLLLEIFLLCGFYTTRNCERPWLHIQAKEVSPSSTTALSKQTAID